MTGLLISHSEEIAASTTTGCGQTHYPPGRSEELHFWHEYPHGEQIKAPWFTQVNTKAHTDLNATV